MNTLLQHKASLYVLAIVVVVITACSAWYTTSANATYAVEKKDVVSSWNAVTAGSFIFN